MLLLQKAQKQLSKEKVLYNPHSSSQSGVGCTKKTPFKIRWQDKNEILRETIGYCILLDFYYILNYLADAFLHIDVQIEHKRTSLS